MKQNNNQKGNVLFLILIAVALFAALSYAVTQSSRSGGDASRETNVLNAAQLTQYPTSIRTAVLRLVIDGYQDTNILYNPPASITTSQDYEVFSTVGGGAIYQTAPREVMQTGGVNTAGTWYINMDFEVPQLGRSAASIAGNELIAFLPGITESVCTRVNLEAGVIASATTANPAFGSNVITGNVAGSVQRNIGLLTHYGTSNVQFPAAFTRQSFGCFSNAAVTTGPFVMYVVLLER